MAHSVADSVYPRLPIALQNAMCWFYGRRESRARFGRTFHARLAQLMASERWSASEIEAHQDARLHALIREAYEHVPYYRERMRERGLVPDDIRTRADLPKLPILTKEDVRQHGEALLSRRAERAALIPRKTSGTTGKSLYFYYTNDAVAMQWALWWRLRYRFGVQWGTMHANFTGKPVVPPEQSRPPFWRWSRPLHQAVLNMHHMTPEHVAPIVEFLDEQGFEYWTGYPSVIHMLANSALEAGLTMRNPPQLAFSGAENMLEQQRADIAAFTGATLTDHYGFSEGCGNASRCEHQAYHEDFEFGILECADPEPTEDGGVRGRILATGFACPEFPFIRYDVGDTAVWEPESHRCACGRESRVLRRIEGRVEDYVLTPEGRRIMRFDYVFKDAQNVREAQVLQTAPDAIRLRIVRRPGYGTTDEVLLTHEIHRWISPRLQVSFEYVPELEREANGKLRAVKSLLSVNGVRVHHG